MPSLQPERHYTSTELFFIILGLAILGAVFVTYHRAFVTRDFTLEQQTSDATSTTE